MFQFLTLKSSITINPKTKSNFVILRAPYRYKLARLDLVFSRYVLKTRLRVTFGFDTVGINPDKFIFILKSFSTKFSCSDVFMHKVRYEFVCVNLQSFFLKNFF
jgi:hypothetical protein